MTGTNHTSVINYPYLPCLRRTGEELFRLGEQKLPFDLLGFWQWSASDLVSNATRGRLAEYIVAMAIGLTSGVRNEWDAYDLQFNEWKIEVKASAYLQSWFQKRLSLPQFSIRPARKWDAVTNETTGEPRRQADVYVFCLHDHKAKATLDPLNLDQWKFFILPSARLDERQRYKEAKSIGLNALLGLKPYMVRFPDLHQCIREVTAQLAKPSGK